MREFSARMIMVVAHVCHEVNAAYCRSIGDDSQKPWDQAEDWQRASAADGVRFRLENKEAPISAQHEAWVAAKKDQGWQYGPVKDPSRKVHPCMVAYADLPENQKTKDALFVAVVESMRHLFD